MSTYYDEAAFLEAWKRGVDLAGIRFFGDGHTPSAEARSKYALAPDFDKVTDALGYLSSGEAVFLASMYSFCNAHAGGLMLAELRATGLGDIAASLDERRVRVLADLMVSYAGW